MDRLPFLKKKKVEGEYRSNLISFIILSVLPEESRKIKANDPTSNAAKKYAVGNEDFQTGKRNRILGK